MELIDPVNSIIIFLSQPTLLRWLTFLLRSQTVILTVLLFWIYLLLDTSICSTMVFPPFGNSKHVIVSVSIDFSSYSYLMPYFIKLLMTNLVLSGMVFMIIWEMFHGMVSLDSVLLLLLVIFCEWVQVGTDVYIPHQKYKVKPHLSPWFSAACVTAIVHRNHFFHLHQKDKSSNQSKVQTG